MDSTSNILRLKSGISKTLLIAYLLVIAVTSYHYHNYPITTVSQQNVSTENEGEQYFALFECTIPHILTKTTTDDNPDHKIIVDQNPNTIYFSVVEKPLKEPVLCFSLRAPPSSV